MTIVCNIRMICLELNWFVYNQSWMLHLSEFVWTLSSSVLVVFNNFLLIDATDKKISRDQKRFFIALCLYPLLFFANTPFKKKYLERSGDSPTLLDLSNLPFFGNKIHFDYNNILKKKIFKILLHRIGIRREWMNTSWLALKSEGSSDLPTFKL